MAFKRKTGVSPSAVTSATRAETPKLRFNAARVEDALLKRAAGKYHRKVTVNVGGSKSTTMVLNTEKLDRDVGAYRKKAAKKKAASLKKAAKASIAKPAAVKPPKFVKPPPVASTMPPKFVKPPKVVTPKPPKFVKPPPVAGTTSRTAVRPAAGSAGSGQKLVVTGGLLAAGRYVAHRASNLLNRTNKLGKYRF